MTTRVMPPGDGLHNSITVNNLTYTAAPGSTLDVPDHDALIMITNGWVAPATGSMVGTTSQRPGKPTPNQSFIDLTLNSGAGLVIVWDALGKTWRNPITGAAV